MNLPLLRQLLVVSSAQLASISVGGTLGLPSVLLQQFKRNDSQIQIDIDTESWIASVHGIAGVSSLFIPYLAQCWGRKFGFRISCILMFIGWLVLYFANTSLIVIIAELFQGLGAKSLLVVTMIILGEMIDPRIRNASIASYGIVQTIFILCIHVAGRYIHWKTISLSICFPLALTFSFSFIWPESPAWLAYKGRFNESKESFIWLRGKNKESLMEMNAIFTAQREILQAQMSSETLKRNKPLMRNIWEKISRRDFYLPTFHMFVVLCCYYWSGIVVILVYAVNLVEKFIENPESAFIGMIFIDAALIIGNITSMLLLKYYGNKTIFVTGGAFAAFFLIGSSIVSFLQHISVLPEDSLLCLYFLVGFMVSSATGFYMIPFAMAAEIMPLKHKGIGGSLCILFICLHYTTTLKIAPYLIIYLGTYGTFLLYAIIVTVGLIWTWIYVPETKNKTLQSIEEYYVEKDKISKPNEDEECNESVTLTTTQTKT